MGEASGCAQALSAAAWLVSSDPANGGARSEALTGQHGATTYNGLYDAESTG